ncbi:MAG: NADH-quinone oxidoreductase subunit C [Desulfovibrio sp.]|nr:MAG: NADH-quinone oxidoreductase subunit C [Desulfovibrio sp.]
MSETLFEGLETQAILSLDPVVTGQVLCVYLDKGVLKDAVKRLDEAGYYIEDVMGVDVAEGFELHYHFCLFQDGPTRITLKVQVPHDDPTVPTISDIYPGAQWHERETRDFYYITFEGIANDSPILLAADMADAAPLRKAEGAHKSYLDLAPPYEILQSEDEHPLIKLAADREQAAKEAAEKAEAERKAAEEAAAKKAAEEAAAKEAEAKEAEA